MNLAATYSSRFCSCGIGKRTVSLFRFNNFRAIAVMYEVFRLNARCLANIVAVFAPAGAGASQTRGAPHQLVVQRISRHALSWDSRIEQIAKVEVAVADMADEEVRDAAGIGPGN